MCTFMFAFIAYIMCDEYLAFYFLSECYDNHCRYCLMSVAGCYTDFHLDFGGTSVWYHVLKGEKVFLLIPPSATNYSSFQHWQMSGEQERVFLAEVVDKAQIVHLHAGDTFIMPAGANTMCMSMSRF